MKFIIERVSSWNKVMTKHRKDEETKMKIEQMNKAKEMRKENE